MGSGISGKRSVKLVTSRSEPSTPELSLMNKIDLPSAGLNGIVEGYRKKRMSAAKIPVPATAAAGEKRAVSTGDATSNIKPVKHAPAMGIPKLSQEPYSKSQST